MEADRWALIHNYRRLVEAGNALPINCPDCEESYMTVVGKDDEPAFKCLVCKSVVTPGLAIWSQIEKAVNV